MIPVLNNGAFASHQSGLRPSFHQKTNPWNLSLTYPEPSGFARPTVPANYGYLWLNEDSGGPNTFLAVNLATGAASGSWTLQGISQSDFEDCASARINGTSYLYMGDIGDNASARSTIIVYRCKEPTITGSNGTIVSGDIETITCEYPAGNLPAHKDCECMLADPDTGDLYFVTKRIFPAKVYRLPYAASYAGTQTLEYMGKLATDTSASSVLIGTGSKSFTTVSGLAFPVGMKLRIASRANAANFMEGEVTSIAGTALTIFVEVAGSKATTGGSGTLSDWDISLATSFTPTGNNGCVTGGSIAPNGTEIALCNYEGLFLWTRTKNQTIYQALSAAPKFLAGDNPGGGSFYNSDIPAFPQLESVEYSNAGTHFYAVSEKISGNGTVNPFAVFARASKPVTTLRLQQGLNGYTGCVDTFIDSAVPGTDQSGAASLVADINFQGGTAFSAVASAASGTQIDVTVASATGFAVGRGALITGSSVSAYNGTWEVTNVAGLVIRLKCPFSATATGTLNAHTQDRQVLLKFTDLSGIPNGATIVDAKLRIYINTEGQSLQVNRMLTAWLGTSTWTSLGGIFPDDGSDAVAVKDARVPGAVMDTYLGFFTVNIPVATIQGWKDGTLTNEGWTIQEDSADTTGDGFQMDSAESATQTRKPMLIIGYTT